MSTAVEGVDTPGRSTTPRSARTRPHRDRGGDTRRLDHPPHRSVGRNEDLARDLGRPQVRAQPEQDPQACAVDVAQTGEVERDSGVFTRDANTAAAAGYSPGRWTGRSPPPTRSAGDPSRCGGGHARWAPGAWLAEGGGPAGRRSGAGLCTGWRSSTLVPRESCWMRTQSMRRRIRTTPRPCPGGRGPDGGSRQRPWSRICTQSASDSVQRSRRRRRVPVGGGRRVRRRWPLPRRRPARSRRADPGQGNALRYSFIACRNRHRCAVPPAASGGRTRHGRSAVASPTLSRLHSGT